MATICADPAVTGTVFSTPCFSGPCSEVYPEKCFQDAGLTLDGCSAASLPKYSGLAALRTLVDSRRVLSVNCDGDVE